MSRTKLVLGLGLEMHKTINLHARRPLPKSAMATSRRRARRLIVLCISNFSHVTMKSLSMVSVVHETTQQ